MTEQNSKNPHIYRIVILSVIITCLLFFILLVALLVFLPSPTFLSYLGYADSVTLANSTNINDPFTSHIIGELVKSGTLISLKDVWSFQSGFYQTIITFLIAINGLIAAISVFYIKSTSEEKAEEITKKYMHSSSFGMVLKEKIKKQVKIPKQDLSDFSKGLEAAWQNVDDGVDRLNVLETENQTLRQQIKIISERIAALDTSESEGKDEYLKKKER